MKSILVILTALGCTSGLAQSQPAEKYIEVTVTDSVVVSPDKIEYILQLRDDNAYTYSAEGTDYNNSGMDYAEEQKKKEEEKLAQLRIQEKQLTDLLNKEKIKFNHSHEEGGGYMFYYLKVESKSYVIQFTSFAQMNSILDKIPETVKYNGFVAQVRFSKQQELENELLTKTFNKARAQAQQIATLSGVKLGLLIQYSDNGDNIIKSIEHMVENLMKSTSRKNILSVTSRITVSKTVRIRFAIE